MKTKLSNLLSTKRKKTIAIMAITALILSCGTITVMAGNDMNIPSLIKNENGNISYSTDYGETWTEGMPDDFNSITDENGLTRSWCGREQTLIDDKGSFAVKCEDGKIFYSTDGGETWIEKVPDNVMHNDDGSVTFGHSNPNRYPYENPNEKGNVSYSTDGGETWIEGMPDGFHSETDENGLTRSWFGREEPPIDDEGFTAKYQGNNMNYSNNLSTLYEKSTGNCTINS